MQKIEDAIGKHDRSAACLDVLRKPSSGIDRMA